MAESPTTPHESGSLAPVRTLRVQVVEGPDAGRSVWSSDDRLSVGTAKDNDLVLGDATVSRYHLELRRSERGIVVSDPGSTNGSWVGSARIERAVLAPGTLIEIGRTRLELGEGAQVDVELHDEDRLGDIVGVSAAMRRVMAWVKRAAKSEASVLITGESGTGKELVARAIHERSGRAEGPFVTVDCGALAPTLVASELFGHERGAFTGAERQRIGALERAHRGTLFLDEIGELPVELQPVLLGALERRVFSRVGGDTDVAVDVRVVAATNRDLRAEINDGTFRLDLYYRLAVLKVTLPALRERREDIAWLVRAFLEELDASDPVRALFDARTLEALAAQHWPGNIRELRNMVLASVALEEVALPDAPLAASEGGVDPFVDLGGLPFKHARREALARFERSYLTRLLAQNADNVSQAAREAGLDRSYLFSLLKKSNLR